MCSQNWIKCTLICTEHSLEVFLGMENLAKNVRYNSGKNVYKNVDTLLKNQFQNCYFAFQKILFFQLTEALGFLYFICTVLTVGSAAPSDRTMGRLRDYEIRTRDR